MESGRVVFGGGGESVTEAVAGIVVSWVVPVDLRGRVGLVQRGEVVHVQRRRARRVGRPRPECVRTAFRARPRQRHCTYITKCNFD